jgi:hypothetical protein
MSQPTTIHLHRLPTIGVRTPVPVSASSAVAIAVRILLATVVALSLVAALSSVDERLTGTPTRLGPPAVIVRDTGRMTIADPVEATPAPAPAPGS